MRQRILAALLSLFLLTELLPAAALAAGGPTWTDVVTEQPAGYVTDASGNVTVSSAEGLAWLARQVNGGASFAGKTVTLDRAIDLSAYEWVPIGTQANPFSGTFDGGTHTISGMRITVSEADPAAGLFGYAGTSTIQNVVMQGSSITGTVTAESNCTVNLGGLVGVNVDRANVTIQNCTADTTVTLTTTGNVVTNIGGVIGYVEDSSGTSATIRDTDVSLAVDYTSTDTSNTTNIGGVIGDIHAYQDTTTVESGEVRLSVSITGSADGWSTLYHIGGAVGYMPTHGSAAANTVVSLQKMSFDSTLDFTASTGILTDAVFSAPAEIGGIFGRGFRYQITDCFSNILLRGPDGETPSHFGNLAGYTYNDEILCERVYTYAARYQGNTLFENERLSKDHSDMADYPLTDVYYIEPQELTEGVEGVPFLYKTFHASHSVTAGINDSFVYRDGDSGDGIAVTPGADQKTVSITPAGEHCAVGGQLTLPSGFVVDFILPVPVYPAGGGTYAITCETENGGYSSKVTTDPAAQAQAGDSVTITAKPVPSSTRLVDSVTVTTADGTTIPVNRTSGGGTGNQTYTFTMPASDVTVKGVFRQISTAFTLSPSTVEFELSEGYTSADVEPVTVTIANTGDLDVTFEGSYALPTSAYYEIQPADGNWGRTDGREITIAPGETATFTVAPKPGLTSSSNPNTIRPLFYSTERERVYLTIRCNVVQAPASYTITADAGSGGTISPIGAVEVAAGDSQAFTFTADPGYQVADVLVDGSSIGPCASYEFPAVASAHTIAVQFEPIQYRITYDLDGGTMASPNPASYTVESPSFTLKNPTRDGYTFLGWTAAGATTPSTALTIPTGTTGDLQFTAHWQKNSSGGGASHDYTLRYDTNGGSAIPSETRGSAWTKSYGELPAPVRDGYVFDGWYLDSGLTELVETDVRVSRTTVTLYAGWRESTADPDSSGVSNWLNAEDHMAYLSGYASGTFGPDNDMTRAEAAQMFYNLLRNPDVPITVAFSDVSEDAWYATAVNTLASLGIVKGTGNNQFAPERPITRAEFTVIAMRFTDGTAGGENTFSDVRVQDWFYDQVVGSIQYGWITGYSDGTFRPNHTITRAEVTTIVNRMLGRHADERAVRQQLPALRRFPDVTPSHWAYYQIAEAANTHDYVKDHAGEQWVRIG